MIAAKQVAIGNEVVFVLKEVGADFKRGTVVIPNTDSRVTEQSAPQFLAMYAIRPINGIYHLVTRGGQDTLCGLRVSRITSDRAGNSLQLVYEVPVDRTICKHCERIQSQDAPK